MYYFTFLEPAAEVISIFSFHLIRLGWVFWNIFISFDQNWLEFYIFLFDFITLDCWRINICNLFYETQLLKFSKKYDFHLINLVCLHCINIWTSFDQIRLLTFSKYLQFILPDSAAETSKNYASNLIRLRCWYCTYNLFKFIRLGCLDGPKIFIFHLIRLGCSDLKYLRFFWSHSAAEITQIFV